MKIRSGFVSNSSSSSFLMYGTYVDNEKIEEIKQFPSLKKEFEDKDLEKYDIAEILVSLNKDLESETMPDDEGFYIGISWDKVKDDETGKQFKNRVKEVLEKIIGKCELGTHSEAWYNG